MKDIEKIISPFIENQFPDFYREEGPQFVAFVKAYYEWLENNGSYYNYSGDLVTQYIAANNNIVSLTADQLANTEYLNSLTVPLTWANSGYKAVGAGVTYHSRRLNDYRDIDDTADEFVVQFKEKYLKNIQFDTATNKRLLVKNALDLYRSKGTERSVDLFFKLVYGTAAEIKYPADNILRVSDGIWEKPEYLEITFNTYNVDYVGKEIIGALSGARAFVEKYIRRRVGFGYVNLLYISNRVGEFRNGEVIGINTNNVPDFTRAKRAQLIGSVARLVIQDKSTEFNVGDTVTLQNSTRGTGGLARVAGIDTATGLVDFIFIDGGYGYTIDATSLISEKVLSLGNISANVNSEQYFRLFEQLAEPLINVYFTSATGTLAAGDYVYRYASNGNVAGTGIVIGTDQSNTSGQATISHIGGVFTPRSTYYIGGNTSSFYANTIEDRTISGKVMGIPESYTVQLSNQNGTLIVGQNVVQKNTTTVFARGTVNSIAVTPIGNAVVITNARGAFKNSEILGKASYQTFTGTITSNTSNSIVVGTGTTFDNNYIGSTLFELPGNTSLGTVQSIINSTALSLSSNANFAFTGVAGAYQPESQIYSNGNGALSVSANVETVSATVGVYQIKKFVSTIQYQSANNDELLYSDEIYQYGPGGNVISEGVLLTVDHNSNTNSGNLTFIPIRGYFNETDTFYTEGNTFSAIVTTYSVSNTGGDYINSPYARVLAPISNTGATVSGISYGSGAGFGVGSIGDTEVIFIGTDLIGSNNVGTLDYDRKILTVASNTGFGVGDYVYQTINKIAFNANSSVNATTGFITLPNANTRFTVGDNIRYEVAAGNTALTGMIDGDYYHVRFANSTGLILSYPYRKTDYINTSNFSTFANNKVNEAGHYLYKQVYGTVFESSTGVVKIKDRVNYFGNTGGTANTTISANSNLIKYGTPSTNTTLQNVTVYNTIVQANQAYAAVPIRAGAYGFPKNPQGDLADVIYSCLNFGRFEIGSIGSLAQVDPGSEYNVDPYVLAYQPYISAFDRNDFIITVNNATRTYVTGERVNQTQANIQYYDLQVDTGAYSNTYDEIQYSIDSQTSVNSTADFIYTTSNNDLVDGQRVLYRTPASNTAIPGLANNTAYYIVGANSLGFQLTDTLAGLPKAINAAATSETHLISTVPGFLPGDRVYQNAAGISNATVHSIYLDGANGFVRVVGNTGVLSTGNMLYSYTNPYVVANVSNVSLFSIVSTAKGIIKAGSNSSVLRVKRLTFENTFKPGTELVGDISGSRANVISVSEDRDELYPIGLNASIEANVTTSNGQVTSLEVVDSGFGYSNAEVVQFVSADGTRAGSAKIVIDGSGKGRGFYRSSKGFLSEDMYVHDGDYYQEYSYEVLSKISVDRYADMFKKVMHMAGTKFFGSALVVEEAALTMTLSQIATSQQIQFNAATDVSSSADTIKLDIEARKYEFDALDDVDQEAEFFTLTNLPNYNPVKLAVGDLVQYTSNTGNFIGGMSNNSFYYVIFANTSGVKLSTTKDGAVLDVNTAALGSEKHALTQLINPFSDGDAVVYSVDTGNTVVTGLTGGSSYYIVNSTPNTVKLSLTSNGSPINITANTTTSGANTAGHYLTKTIEE